MFSATSFNSKLTNRTKASPQQTSKPIELNIQTSQPLNIRPQNPTSHSQISSHDNDDGTSSSSFPSTHAQRNQVTLRTKLRLSKSGRGFGRMDQDFESGQWKECCRLASITHLNGKMYQG